MAVATGKLLLTAALLLLFPLVRGQCSVTINTTKDEETLQTGQETVNEWCGQKSDLQITPDERDKNKELLEEVGDVEWLDENLRTADSDEFVDSLQEKYFDNYMTLIKDAGAIGFAIFFLICHCICCWTYCPCYACSTDGKRNWKVMLALKFLVLVFAAMCGLGCVITASQILAYAVDFQNGVTMTLCNTGELAVATFGGDGATWPGLTGVSDFFLELNDIVAAGSPFLTDISGVLDDTEELDQAVLLVTETLDLLSATMSLPQNEIPEYDLLIEGYHTCIMCSETPGVVDPVSEQIADGMATALVNARDEVEAQLSGDQIVDLREQLCSNTETVVDAKDSARDKIDSLLDGIDGDSDLGSSLDHIPNGAMAFAILGIFVVLWSACGACCCSLCDGAILNVCRGSAATGEPRDVTKCSTPILLVNCCGWWCGGWLTIFMFIFGGILLFFTVPVASFCILLDDLTGEDLTAYGAALDLDDGSGTWDQAVSVLDTCFLKDGDGDLLGNLIIDNTSMKDRLTTELRDQINAAFDDIGGMSDTNIADSQEFQDLQDTLSTDVAKTTTTLGAQKTSLLNDPLYSAMPVQLSAWVEAVSLHCDDAPPPGLYGIQHFYDQVHAYFTSIGPFTCAPTTAADLACATAIFAPGTTKDECDAVQNYIDLKYNLITAGSVYRCDVFTNDNGSPCDILNMGPAPTYTNDCIRSDNTIVRKVQNCDYNTFKQYVYDYGATNGRLEKVVKRLDDVIPAMKTKIEQDLQDIVNTNLLDPIDEFVSSTNCQFTQDAYSNFIDSMCYQVLASGRRIAVRYVGCAVFAMFATILCFFIFRFMMNTYRNQTKVTPE